jgi:imidazolonepropionase-like amidohydrolase
MRELGIEIEPDQLVAEVERQVAAGDGWVKLVGDWIDRDLGELAPLWPDDVLAAAIGRAHELGARVAAHVFGEDALPGLIAAGLDSIEHGTGLTADLLDEVARRDIAVVPTLINMRNLPQIAAGGAEKFPGWAAHLRALHKTGDERIRAAWEAGVALYTGTDAGGSLPHGLIAAEIEAMVQLGIPLPEVIAQASWRGRDWLGLPGLDEGAPADLVVYDADPRRDLAAVRAPRRMLLRGAVVS